MILVCKHIRYYLCSRKTLLLFLLALASLSVCAQSTVAREYQVKAVFLYNFTQFVEWPAAAGQTTQPFVIGILGTDPFGRYLEETVAGEKVAGRSVIVQRFNDVSEITSCHILYINRIKLNEETLAALRRRGILTVSDHNSFIQQGGMVRFYTANNKIRFQINLPVTKAAQLNISSKLLRVADIVE